jgi:hypothetical protein
MKVATSTINEKHTLLAKSRKVFEFSKGRIKQKKYHLPGESLSVSNWEKMRIMYIPGN